MAHLCGPFFVTKEGKMMRWGTELKVYAIVFGNVGALYDFYFVSLQQII